MPILINVLFSCFLLLIASHAVAGRHIIADPSNYRTLLKSMLPGDTMQLTAGEYRGGLPLHNLQGQANEPITIAGPNSGQRAVFLARVSHNTVSIYNSSYITIRNLVLDGLNLPVDGVKAEGDADWAHHITLENLLIRNHGNNQQTVGISTKCPAWNWEVRGNVITGAGTGMYFGDSDGSDPFVASLIEHNLVVDTIGYNLQIKHQNTRPVIPGMPLGDQQTIIRHNVFSKAMRGSKGPMARPNVLVGHWPLSGAGQEDQYLIYGNFFYQNPNEALFQGEGNLALYNNLFLNDSADAIHIQPHNNIPRRISIFFNTVITTTTGIVIRQRQDDPTMQSTNYPQRVVANAVFASRPINARNQKGNITAQVSQAKNYLRNPLAQPGEMDLRPHKYMMAKFDSGVLEEYLDWNLDFNNHPRKEGTVGAYSGNKNATHWVPRIERKP